MCLIVWWLDKLFSSWLKRIKEIKSLCDEDNLIIKMIFLKIISPKIKKFLEMLINRIKLHLY